MQEKQGRQETRGLFRLVVGWTLDWLPLLTCLSAGVGIWLIFWPGNYSIDSIMQISQAMDHRYNDCHPPIMAITLHYFLQIGGTIGRLILGQCLLGVLGVYLLAQGILGRINGPGRGGRGRRWQALVVTAVMLCPISPLGVYLATFWKDVWFLISLTWVAVFTFRALDPTLARPRAWDLVGLVFTMVFAILTRHNALAAAPAFGLLAALAVGRRAGRWAGVAVLVLPGALALGAEQGLRRGWHVEHFDFASFLRLNDMTSLCAASPEVERESPFMRSLLVPHFRDQFVYGMVAFNYDRCLDRPTLNRAFSTPDGRTRLAVEFNRAIRRHPLSYAWTKYQGILYHLGNPPDGKFCWGINPNQIGVAYRGDPTGLREKWFPFLWQAFQHPVYRWIFWKHVVWLAINLVGVSLLLWPGVRRDWRRATVPLLFLATLGYYSSYIVAVCGADFRYMYPADLIVQITTYTSLIGWSFLGITSLVGWSFLGIRWLGHLARPHPEQPTANVATSPESAPEDYGQIRRAG